MSKNTTLTSQAWDSFSHLIYQFIRSKVNNDADAQDLRQEVFAKVHLNIDQLRDYSKVKSWIYNIARNTINDHYRKSYTKDATENKNGLVEIETDDTEDWTVQFEKCLVHMIHDLPEKYRIPIEMSELQGKQQTQVAQELELSYSGTKSRIQRGKVMLRDSFKECCNIEVNKKGQLVSGDVEMNHCKKC